MAPRRLVNVTHSIKRASLEYDDQTNVWRLRPGFSLFLYKFGYCKIEKETPRVNVGLKKRFDAVNCRTGCMLLSLSTQPRGHDDVQVPLYSS
jgi:hypothetical protein